MDTRSNRGNRPSESVAFPAPSESPIETASREFHLEIGAPRGYLELFNEGYVVGYDPRLKIPAWVRAADHKSNEPY